MKAMLAERQIISDPLEQTLSNSKEGADQEVFSEHQNIDRDSNSIYFLHTIKLNMCIPSVQE